MSRIKTYYVIYLDLGDSRGPVNIGTVDNESAVEGYIERYAEDLDIAVPEYEVHEIAVPLPEVVVRIENGFVSSVTTVDGLELEATVRDYDTAEGDNLGGGGTDVFGYYEEYTV